MADVYKEPCAFCGAQPITKNISGIYYAQCGNPNCCDNEPYAFMGRLAGIALAQWNCHQTYIKNYPTNRSKGLLKTRRTKGRRV